MKKILLAVDDTKSSLRTCELLAALLKSCPPEELFLLFVQKLEGKSVMDDLLLSESEIETLRESMQGTEHQELLDKRAAKILEHFKGCLTSKGIAKVRPMTRAGHPAEEIMRAAREVKAEMIVMGTRSQRLHNLFMGSVSREIANSSELPVLLLR